MATASLPTIPFGIQAVPTLAGRTPSHLHAAASAPLHADAASVIALLGADAGPGDAGGERFTVLRVACGATLVHEGAPAHALYVVQTGSFKTVRTADDGYEHVLGFAWRGDLLGVDSLARHHHEFGAVALEDSRVVALPLGALQALRQRSPAFDGALQTAMARQLLQAGEIARVMAAVASEARVARFLVALSAAMAERGQSPCRLLLRMSRRDIANHLGLAHETISRCLRLLSDAGWLRVHDREIEIVDLAALRRCGWNTRRCADDAPMRHGAHTAQPLAAAA